METGTATPPPLPAETPAQRRAAQTEHFIQQQIGRTRRHVKGVDIAAGVLWLVIGVLGFLLAAAMLDQWIVDGGLGFWGRFLLLAVLLGAGGAWFVLRLLPLLIYRINPLFAAQAIEQSQPSLKNSLINFLLVRAQRGRTPEMVYRALEQRAATDLGSVSVDTVVDHSHVVRLGYVLAGVVGLACLYLVVSPKNPLTSFSRVIFPWANIAAPTRVTIDAVDPGDAVISRGEPIPVTAEVRGLRGAESVTLYYTTADGQSIDEAIPMAAADERTHRYELPADSFMAQQDADYYLVAGDCRTRKFHVQVQVAPAIVVDSVTYDYPAYTRIPKATIDKQGDLRAIEGTRVTVRATANLPIGKAEIDLGCDGRGSLSMQVDGRTATGQFTLRTRRDDPSAPQYDSYQLQFTDTEGRRNRRPVRYQIEVIPDLAPRVSIAAPSYDPLPEEIQLPLGETLEFQVRAEDPDFGLRHVTLHVQRQGHALMVPPLLDPSSLGEKAAHEGPFEAAYRFDPQRLELQPGEVVTYWAEARDNKQPVANRAETEKRRIVIVAIDPDGQPQQRPQPGQGEPQPPDQQQNPEAGAERPQQQPGAQEQPMEGQPREENPPREQPAPGQQEAEKPQSKDQGDQQSKSQNQPGEGQPSGDNQPQQGEGDSKQSGQGEGGQDQQPAEEPSRTDPVSNAGEAFEKILEHKQQEDQQNKPDGNQPGGQPEQKPEKKPDQPQEQQPGEQPQQQPGEQKQPGEGQQPKPEGGQPGAEQKAEPSEGQPQAKPDGQPQEGSGAGGQPQPGEPKPGEQPANPQQPNEGATGGQPKPGEPNAAQPKPDGQPGEGQKPGEQMNPNEGQPGEGKPQPNDPQQKRGEASPRGSQPDEKDPQQIGDNEQSGKGKNPQGQPSDGQGAQSQGSPRPGQQPQEGQPDGQPKPENKGGDPEQGKGNAGAGKPTEPSEGTPSPQHNNTARDKQPGAQEQGQGEKQEGKSPSISPHESDSKSETAGDHSGGGEEGGGQRANQQGTGAPGSHSESDQGANTGTSKGQGDVGTQGGDQVESKRPTGSTGEKKDGSGGEGRQKPGGGTGQKPSAGQADDPSGAKKAPTDQPGGQTQGESNEKPNAHGAGNPTAGGLPGKHSDVPPQPGEPLPGGDDPNLDYARKATGMALEHLRDQMTKEHSELLDELKWTRQDAEQFLRRWEELRKQGGETSRRTGTGHKELDDVLRNLGLRPQGTELGSGQIKADQLKGLREARDFQPPPEWAEQFRAFKMGVSGQPER